MDEHLQQYLAPSEFINSDHAVVMQFAQKHSAEACGDKARAITLYNAVRDRILYDPYRLPQTRAQYSASNTITSKRGFCIPKAITLAACARAIGIPARIGFADVRNHLSSPRLLEQMGTDIFYWHGYSQLYIDGQWVKCTPAFNKRLCTRAGIGVLDWDGAQDSLFHPLDTQGNQHMQYLADHGPRDDLPYDALIALYKKHYPKLNIAPISADADFELEAQTP